MNNGRMPSGNKNSAPKAPERTPHQAQNRPNATQKNAPRTSNAAHPQNRPVNRPEPNISSVRFVASTQKTTPRPSRNSPNAAQIKPKTAPNAAQKNSASVSSQKMRAPIRNQSENEAPKRRRNDESYVFSRSLSETRERILEERRERLEDAKKFQKEDVALKLRLGLISLVAVVLIVSIIISIAVSCSLSSGKPKKSKGDYLYTIGTKESTVAFADAVRNDAFYVSMNDIAELCEMTMSGSAATELRFTTKNGDWIAFMPGSNVARINGYTISMSHPAYIRDTACSVPLEFLEFVLDGINVSIDLEEKTVSVLRNEYSDSTPLEPHYVDVSFGLKADSILLPLDENKYFSGQPLFTFKNDLSEYEKYMNPTNRDPYLILINKQNPVGADFVPSEKLVYIDEKRELVETAAKAIEAMLKEMYSYGFTNVYVTSAYRPYSYQTALYYTYIDNESAGISADAYKYFGEAYIKENYLDKGLSKLSREDATLVVNSYSAIPGESEHHTGLCVDLITSDMTELTNVFAETEVYDWLCANAWKFGFILRYPEDKVDITEYSYESWHWRFVGRDTALEMLRTGECLEEYLERTSPSEQP